MSFAAANFLVRRLSDIRPASAVRARDGAMFLRNVKNLECKNSAEAATVLQMSHHH